MFVWSFGRYLTFSDIKCESESLVKLSPSFARSMVVLSPDLRLRLTGIDLQIIAD